jgi:hypothetical protein
MQDFQFRCAPHTDADDWLDSVAVWLGNDRLVPLSPALEVLADFGREGSGECADDCFDGKPEVGITAEVVNFGRGRSRAPNPRMEKKV